MPWYSDHEVAPRLKVSGAIHERKVSAYSGTPLKSQATGPTPDTFFLRPALFREKFPQERQIGLSPPLEARIRAQEAAGQLVFE